jgi:hypothetical protein
MVQFAAVAEIGKTVYNFIASLGIKGGTKHPSYEQSGTASVIFENGVRDAVLKVYSANDAAKIGNNLVSIMINFLTNTDWWGGASQPMRAKDIVKDLTPYVNRGIESLRAAAQIWSQWVIMNSDIDGLQGFFIARINDMFYPLLVEAIKTSGVKETGSSVDITGIGTIGFLPDDGSSSPTGTTVTPVKESTSLPLSVAGIPVNTLIMLGIAGAIAFTLIKKK